jgi:hypothetical protein
MSMLNEINCDNCGQIETCERIIMPPMCCTSLVVYRAYPIILSASWDSQLQHYGERKGYGMKVRRFYTAHDCARIYAQGIAKHILIGIAANAKSRTLRHFILLRPVQLKDTCDVRSELSGRALLKKDTMF